VRNLFKIKNIITILFGLITLVSCQYRENEKTKGKKNDIEILIQSILDLPDLQWIYHSEVNDRLPIKILESGLVTKDLSLNKFDKNVAILTKDELENRKLNDYIFIRELNFIGDTVKFYLTYDIEGAFAEGMFIKEYKKWIMLDYVVGEY